MITFTIYRDYKNEFRWRLKAHNGQVIADSGEGYISKENCRYGISLIRQYASIAAVVDQT